jgi:DNA-binding beta-propeller fold protein YncE
MILSVLSFCLAWAGMAVPAASTESAGTPAGKESADSSPNRLTHRGVVVEFDAQPVGGRPGKGLMAGNLAEVRFRLTEEATGKPIRGIVPGAWMDIGESIQGQEGAPQKTCKEKIALYLKGVIGIRPMIDLNSYYVLVLNREPSISVVDPLVSMVGVTSTLGVISLKGPGADWVKSADSKRVYVSMPTAGEVAVVDAEAFKVITSIGAGPEPTRVALTPDGRYLFVGNDAREAAGSGVTIIDVETLKPVARLATGAGHHEIAFSPESRFAFVTNRTEGTVSVIDVRERKKLKDVKTGPLPISLGYSEKAEAVYVADGKEGTISVLDGTTHEVAARIEAKPGLGPMRFTPDGRFGLVVNLAEDRVFVLDAAENALLHTVEVPGRPYQVFLSRAFAYVRSLDSERVTMINLESLGPGKQPIVQSFGAGSVAPKTAGDLVLADSMASTSSEAAVFVVNPADSTTYFYMEGMNAPMANYKVRGAASRAVTVVDRSLQEAEPGVYVSKVKIPAPGRYDVAFLLETPPILHCFSVEAAADPAHKKDLGRLGIEYLIPRRTVKAGATVPVRFKLSDPATGTPRAGLAGVRVLFFRIPGKDRREVPAREVGGGVYEAMLPMTKPGGYNIYVAVPSEKIRYQDLPYFTMAATRTAAGSPGARPSPAAKPSPGEKE